jgi:hypothetical protein
MHMQLDGTMRDAEIFKVSAYSASLKIIALAHLDYLADYTNAVN